MVDSCLTMCREIEFFLRGHPGEASVLRAKVQEVIDSGGETVDAAPGYVCPGCSRPYTRLVEKL